jgi:uncharacterized membrane protein YbhN (UPF0104 family)
MSSMESSAGRGEESEAQQARSSEMAAQSRSLRNSLIVLAVFFAIVAALLLAVPGLRSVAELISDASVGWVSAAIALEILSCVGYVVLFELLFGKLGWRLASRLALSELAVNAVVSVSGLGGIMLGAWVMRSKGISLERIATRSVELFVITSAVNVVAVAVIGIPMWLGVLPGSSDPLLTLAPAVAAIAAVGATLALAVWADRYAQSNELAHPRTASALAALGSGVRGVLKLLRHPDPRLLGALVYWLCDTLVLYACLLAYGSSPSFWVVAMAYLIGMLANSLPIPGGLVAVEGGLVGMLLLFGVRPASFVLAAVLTYRAIALWVPSLIGSAAFLSIRREIGQPLVARARVAER